MSFQNGILNLTNWSANVILPTLAGLFFAFAIVRFSKHLEYSHAVYGGFLCLMASGVLRSLETFASQRAWNDPDLYWSSILALVNWVCNVVMPLYAALQVAAGGASLVTNMHIHQTSGWQRHFLAAGLCLLLSGLLRLAEHFITQGVGGVT